MPTDALHRFTWLEALILTGPAFLMMFYYFRRASKLGTFAALTFLLSIGYGLSLELFDIRASEAYFYTDLKFMVGSAPNWVPLFIGVCWAGILFVAMQTSDRLNLPIKLRPIYDGALGLSLDLVLDPSASNSVFVPHMGTTCSESTSTPFGGIGVWTWCVPETGGQPLWFSVPISNFIGWFIVLALASAAVRIIRGKLRGESRPVHTQLLMLTVGFVLAAVGLVTILSMLLKVVTSATGLCILFGALVLSPLALVFVYRKQAVFDNSLDAGLLMFPIYILVWETGTFIVAGVDRASWPAPLLTIMATALFSALLWLMPSLRRWRTVASTSAHTASSVH